ncbi:MAG: hypothetical protein QM658_00665 [Gordonia sp. (in: high G+C Gram-positive bacteria)]
MVGPLIIVAGVAIGALELAALFLSVMGAVWVYQHRSELATIAEEILAGKTPSELTVEQMAKLAILLGSVMQGSPDQDDKPRKGGRTDPGTPRVRPSDPGDHPDQDDDDPAPDDPVVQPPLPGDTPQPAEPVPDPDPEQPDSPRPPELPKRGEPRPWDPPKHPELPGEEPPFGVPQTPDGPEPIEKIFEYVRDWLAAIINAETPPGDNGEPDGNDDTPKHDKLPVGEVPPPEPGDPLYPLFKALSEYHRNYWLATGHSPIGKQIHHAIEQVVFRNFPGLFDDDFMHHEDNLRGFWGRIAPEVHLSRIRMAWNSIYIYIYMSLGIDVRNPDSIPDDRIEEVRSGLLLGVLLVDLMFGKWMTPSPPWLDGAPELLRELGVSEDRIADFEEMSTLERLRLLRSVVMSRTA